MRKNDAARRGEERFKYFVREMGRDEAVRTELLGDLVELEALRGEVEGLRGKVDGADYIARCLCISDCFEYERWD